MPNRRAEWPTLERSGAWPATQDYLHLVVQMLGKLRLALASPLPEWSHTPLALTPRGLTTRAMPQHRESVEATLDVIDGLVRLSASDGRTRTIELVPARPIAEIWSAFNEAVRALGIDADLWDKPQERADLTLFSEDNRPRMYEATLANSWFALLTELSAVFEELRSPFFGRSAVSFWWGGFDLTLVMFNGRHAVPPARSNLLMRYDLDAEHLSIGFWPGDASHDPMFFAYLVPEPLSCADYPLDVPAAAWAPTMGEWVLPYEAVRTARHRHKLLRQFVDSILRAAGTIAGWDLRPLTYAAPPRRPNA